MDMRTFLLALAASFLIMPLALGQENPLAIPPDKMPDFCALEWADSPTTFVTGKDDETIRKLAGYWYGDQPEGFSNTVKAVYSNEYIAADGVADGQSLLITLWQFATPDAAAAAVDSLTSRGARNVRAMLDYNQAVVQKYDEDTTQECADWMWRELERGMGR